MERILLATLLLFSYSIYGQTNRSAHWYFGYQAGIDFSSGQPIIDTIGKLISIEGCSSISDTSGNLLFYSNAEKIWNRSNTIMPNSVGLVGDQSSAQSSLIVPLPGSNSYYYLFNTIGSNSNAGLYYNIIDMNLDNGLGDINSSKNVLLYNSGTEELASTLHCNGNDYWIVSRQSVVDTLKIFSYLLTNSGLSNPVLSKFYFPNPPWNTVGCLSFSQDGKTLCFSSFGTPIYIFDFDLQTGELKLQYSISRYNNEQVYSNAFSPDSKKLYITSWGAFGYSFLSQFDLTAPNITASRINIDSVDYSNGSPNGYGFIGQIKLAPDQRIYVCRWSQVNPFQTNPNTYYTLDSLDAIINPNSPGFLSNFQRDFLYLNHKPTQIGLPNFVSNYTSLTTPTYNCTTGIVSNSSINLDLELYPNPFSIETTLRTNDFFNNTTLTVYNSIGQQVKQIKNISGQAITLSRENIPSGLYFIRVSQDNKTFGTEKLLITD
jgi:hypothetical protein